jgi:hypothetical protein
MITQYHGLSNQGAAIGMKGMRVTTPISTFMSKPAMPSADEPAQPAPMEPEKFEAVDGVEPEPRESVIGEGEAQAGAELKDPEGAFESFVGEDMLSGMVGRAAGSAATNAGIALALDAPTGVAAKFGLSSIMAPISGLKTIADTATKGYAAENVADLYGDPKMDKGLYGEISAMAGPESELDPTEAFSPSEMKDWDTTRQEVAAYLDNTTNPAKPFYGGIIAPQMTALVGDDMGKRRDVAIDTALEDEGVFDAERGLRSSIKDAQVTDSVVAPEYLQQIQAQSQEGGRNGAVSEAGPSATSGNAPVREGGYGYGGMGSGGWTPDSYKDLGLANNFAGGRDMYGRDGNGGGSSGGAANGGGRAGNAGTSDASGGMGGY